MKLTWDEWLGVSAPYREVGFTRKNVFTRYHRNGYDWDMHGILYTPAKEVDPNIAFVIFHGGAGSAMGKDKTPDGRPGISRILATQGFEVLALSFTGHYPPGGIWTVPVDERMPVYLLDRELPEEEILDRNRKCTFNTIVQGGAQLADEHLAGRKILAFGHSTGGPMAAFLYKFTKKTEVVGLVGFGTGGPVGWRKEWQDAYKHSAKEKPIDFISRRSPETFRESGYDDSPEGICPWGGAESFMKWGDSIRSHIKLALCDNQHRAAIRKLDEYPALTGLPREEYFDHLDGPNPEWLKSIGVILLVGGNDRGHWRIGERDEDKREVFIAKKYRQYTPRSHVVFIPHYSHYGIMELYNDKIAYLWLWAYKSGHFKT